MNNIRCSIGAVLLIPSVALAGVYKCEKNDGGFVYQGQPCEAGSRSITSWGSQTAENGNGGDAPTELVLGQGRGGHYFVDGAVNGHYLNFVIDTGASVVTLPAGTATSAGLRCRERAAIDTANGTSSACIVRIDKLTFGGFTLVDVDALAAPNLTQPLLGMNVLKRFHVDQGNSQMRLTRNY